MYSCRYRQPWSSPIPDKQATILDRCPPLPLIADRPILSPEQAVQLEAIFKMLANTTRLRMLHALVRVPDLSVGALAEAVGMKPQAVSNQLRRLVDRGIVAPRRDGNNVRYRTVDACTVDLLDRAFCLAVCIDTCAPPSATTATSGAPSQADQDART